MRLLVLFAIVVSSFAISVAQQPTSSPPPPPPTSTPPPPAVQPIRGGRAIDPRQANPFSLNQVAESDRLGMRVVAMQRFVAPIYRKPTDKELAAVLPAASILQKYSAFLSRANGGIFRLLADAGCAVNDRVISAKEECIKYSMPGAGNSYSFRTENYRISRLADISLKQGKLGITGVFMHGMMTKIGDVPLESVTLVSAGVDYLVGFKPSTNADEVAETDERLKKGEQHNGLQFAKEFDVDVNSTYVLRAIAYRGKVVRSLGGVSYNELDFDKRKDVIVAFRVVEKGDDGSVTIIWKQLAETDSPKLKMPKLKTDEAADDEDNE